MVLYTRLEISLCVCIYIHNFISHWHQAGSWHLVQTNCSLSWYEPGICVCRANNRSGYFVVFFFSFYFRMSNTQLVILLIKIA